MSQVQLREGTAWSYVIEISGMTVPAKNIIGLTIRESIFDVLPRLEMTMKDAGTFTSEIPIHSGDSIRIKIFNSSYQPKSNDYGFLISSVKTISVDPNSPNDLIAEISAVLEVPEMFSALKSRSFGKKRFSDVAKEVAAECGLEPEIKTKSADSMRWGCFNETYLDFLRKSILHSYVSEKELPVVFSAKNGKMVYCGISREKKSDTSVSLVFDALGTITPAPFDMELARNGKSVSKIVVPYSAWAMTDLKSWADVFDGGSGLSVNWFDGEFRSEKFGDGNITKSDNFGVKSDNVHEYYYKAAGNNATLIRSMFSKCATLTTGIYGFRPADRVYVSIPERSNAGSSQALSGEYIVFQVLTVMNKDATNEILCLSPV